MGRLRIAVVGAVCLLAVGVVGELVMGGPAPSVAVADPFTTEAADLRAPQVVEDWTGDLADWSVGRVAVHDGRVHGFGSPFAGALRRLDPTEGCDLYLRGSVTVVPG